MSERSEQETAELARALLDVVPKVLQRLGLSPILSVPACFVVKLSSEQRFEEKNLVGKG
jgi:hypothetical protein